MSKANLNILVAVCVFLTALAGPAGAVTHYVDPNGSADFTTIQAAIFAASDYDEIEVAPGTYDEAINFNDKAVRLYSKYGPEVTTIDGTGNYHVVLCVSGEDANTILEGFTITGGNANGLIFPDEQCGGGMVNAYDSNPTIRNCIFNGNSAVSGGGMVNGYNSNPTITNCTFSNNIADANGGGMFNYDNSSPTVTNCIFYFNDADYGGGMSNVGSSPTVTNCSFSENMSFSGGGMSNVGSSPTVTNCSFSENMSFSGDGMSNESDSNPTVTNCIFWNGIFTMGQIVTDGMDPLNVSYSDVQDGSGFTGPNNIDADPLFLNAVSGDLRLGSSSPCVDTGDNSAVIVSTDLAGNPRVVDGDQNGTATVDMGAYELQLPRIHNITQDIWYPYYITIQTAIIQANSGDEIEVLPGTYNEAISFIGKAVRLYSSGGPDVTIIDAIAGAYHVVQCTNGEGPDTILEGFTITGGNASGSYPDDCGGGMYNDSSSPTVINCIFAGNSAAYAGGGMYCTNSSSTVVNCTFTGNSTRYGGGMRNYDGSSPTVTNCTFSDNRAISSGGGGGGGMENEADSNPTIANCTFTDNVAGSYGGGMSNYGDCNPTVVNCTFAGNSAVDIGGGMSNQYWSNPMVTNCTFTGNMVTDFSGSGGGMSNYDDCNPTVVNCTFSGNSAADGGGMDNYEFSIPTVTNCIFWDDLPNEIVDGISSSSTVTYSDVEGGWSGAGGNNIDADPLFLADIPDQVQLLSTSPCIDAGDSTGLWQKGILKDMDGKIRYADIAAVADTGTGFVTFVDMGAYEFQCSGIAGDNNCDGVVDFKDFAIMAENWLVGAG